MEKFQAPRGTRDLFGEEVLKFRKAVKVFTETVSLYGFREIITPLFEDTAVFERTIGEGTDIVKKQMYTFKDRGGRSLTLRPEGTATVVRAAISDNLLANLPARFFYTGEMFRYERPQKDRKRQFYQMGAEIFGESSCYADYEAIEICAGVFRNLGIDFTLKMNSIGCSGCRSDYETSLRTFAAGIVDKLCQDCKERFDGNILRILDCKNPQCEELLAEAPELKNSICKTCSDSFEKICGLLDKSGIDYEIDTKLVRGLDYYNGCVFEFFTKEARDAIAAGGRYDDLVKAMGGSSVPAVGFAVGIDRILTNIRVSSERRGTLLFGMGIEEEEILAIAAKIRAQQKTCVISRKEKLKNALKEADRNCFKYVVIRGEDELKNGMITVRNMESGSQETVTPEEFLNKYDL